MIESAPHTSQYRYERKFVVSSLTKHEVEVLIRLHPAMFLDIYPPRFVNNLYFDAFDLEHYFENIESQTDRVKVRIRWYGDLLSVIEKPILELKIKNGPVGRKVSFPLIPFSLAGSEQFETIREVFKKSELPEKLFFDLISLEPVLLDRYRRQYYQSADRRFRLTLDSEIEFYEAQLCGITFLRKSSDFITTIVELKYELSEDQSAEQITSHFPFRIAKVSKYIMGIERFVL